MQRIYTARKNVPETAVMLFQCKAISLSIFVISTLHTTLINRSLPYTTHACKLRLRACLVQTHDMDRVAKILEAARAGPRGTDLPTTDAIFQSVALSVRGQMAEFDASHDFEHILRVTALAHSIFAAEVNHKPLKLDLTAILLAA
jgi:hypothetical protein